MKKEINKICAHFVLHSHTTIHKMVLTVQVDVVTFTPVAPQWRIVQVGAANLDGVVQSGLQIQRRLGFSWDRQHLETSEREPTNMSTHAQPHIHTVKMVRIVWHVCT